MAVQLITFHNSRGFVARKKSGNLCGLYRTLNVGGVARLQRQNMPASNSLSGKALFSVLRVLVAFGIVTAQNGTNATCIRDYFDLEKSLLSSKPNIDSLTKTWFPPNEQRVTVVEVFYYINDSNLVEHPLILELGGLNATELQQRADYRYRWSLTPIYLFMGPQVLEALSLRVINILRHEARLLVDPICENYTVKGIRLPEYHLNQMTSLVKPCSYTILSRYMS